MTETLPEEFCSASSVLAATRASAISAMAGASARPRCQRDEGEPQYESAQHQTSMFRAVIDRDM